MSDIAIRVENVSKQYRIGERERYRSLRDTLSDAFLAPWHRIRSLFQDSGVSQTEGKNSIWSLKDVSFEIKKGEVIGIIGRNGAGKTTLLKILSRITAPTKGRAEIYGRVASLLEVGTGFHPELTGRENIYLNGAVLGMKKTEIDSKFDEIVAFAEVEKFIDTPVKRYSSGMYVRLAFAVAAHLDPEILLVDEVLAVGDAGFQKKCLGKMGDVAKTKRTVIFVSHNMFAVQGLCQRAILLDAGQKKEDGEPAKVIRTYLESGGEKRGEVLWGSHETAPGDHRARLKGVRIVVEGKVSGQADISKNFSIEVDFWNLEPESRRLLSIHLYNELGTCVMTVANLPSASLTLDPWYERCYPAGLFRTACTIPGNLLNDGVYSISIFLNQNRLPSLHESDVIVFVPHVLSFEVQDTGTMRKEFMGKWLGVIRPMLHWQTAQLQ